jgi:8-oxo-dGTP diphosphatase
VSVAERYPALFRPRRWEWAGIDAQFSLDAPPDELVTNIHVVGFVGDGVVLCRTRAGQWFLPGGTREAGESVEGCVARELREEAGAELAGPLRWLGAHACVCDRPAPFRPWQPHPRAAWLWCAADVAIVGAPTNPPDGEQVAEVRVVSVAEAPTLAGTDGEEMAEIVALAVELRSSF